MTLCRTIVIVFLVLGGGAWTTTATPTRVRTAPAPFLEALAGEWSVVTHATLGPGQEPVRLSSKEAARLLGGQWLVAETKASTPDGAPVIAMLTLGYDPSIGRFVGTYISSQQTHLWSYVGELDATGRALTLETEGPIHGDPNRVTRYREVIEVVSANHKVMRSMILGPDGEWFEFARAEYRRSG
jgi:hypothetical protein